MELPADYAHWRGPLETELAATLELYAPMLERWPTDGGRDPRPRAIRVLTPVDAEALYQLEGWEQNPRVPRTFPERRLALAPLPRDDRLLRDSLHIPDTWLHDLQHEAVHLLCLDRPGLDGAPTWFLEGLAEAACGLPMRRPAAWTASGLGDWPHWEDTDAWAPDSAEGLQRGRAHRVLQLLGEDPGLRPWAGHHDVERAVAGAARPLGRVLRGRHGGWWAEHGTFLLAPHAGALVALDLPVQILPSHVGRDVPDPFAWTGEEPLRFALRAGDTGTYADAGLLVASGGREADGWLRLRISESGAFLAQAERSGQALTLEPLHAAPEGSHDGRREVTLTLVGDSLQVVAGDFHRSFPLGDNGLAPPFGFRLYAFDTAVRLDLLEVHDE